MLVKMTKTYLNLKEGEVVEVKEDEGNDLIKKEYATKPEEGEVDIEDVVAKSVDAMSEALAEGVNKRLNEVLKKYAEAQTKSIKNKIPAIFGDGGEGDPKKTFGSFLLAVAKKDYKTLHDLGSYGVDWTDGKKAALAEGVGTTGGFTVPEEFHDDLLDLTAEQSFVKQRATVIPMRRASMNVPALDMTTAPSAGNSAFFGGVVASWGDEADALTETEPTFRNIRLEAHKLQGYSLSSNEMLDDSAVGLEALLRKLFTGAIAWHEDYNFLRGNGVGKPLGVLTSACLITETRSAGSAFALADVAVMYGRMLPGGSNSSRVWAIHPTVVKKLLQQTDGSNIIFIDNVRGKPTWTILGDPVVITEKLPALNTAGDVLFMDLRHYLVGDRQDIEIAASEHFRFTNDQMAFRFIARVDGQPWLNSAVTLSDATSTLSPFIALAAG